MTAVSEGRSASSSGSSTSDSLLLHSQLSALLLENQELRAANAAFQAASRKPVWPFHLPPPDCGIAMTMTAVSEGRSASSSGSSTSDSLLLHSQLSALLLENQELRAANAAFQAASRKPVWLFHLPPQDCGIAMTAVSRSWAEGELGRVRLELARRERDLERAEEAAEEERRRAARLHRELEELQLDLAAAKDAASLRRDATSVSSLLSTVTTELPTTPLSTSDATRDHPKLHQSGNYDFPTRKLRRSASPPLGHQSKGRLLKSPSPRLLHFAPCPPSDYDPSPRALHPPSDDNLALSSPRVIHSVRSFHPDLDTTIGAWSTVSNLTTVVAAHRVVESGTQTEEEEEEKEEEEEQRAGVVDFAAPAFAWMLYNVLT